MKTLDFKNVKLNSGFLYEKELLNKNVTIDAVYKRFYETGRISAFDFGWKEGKENKPHFFWDSDVAKWMEGAAYILHKGPNKDLEEKIESLIDKIEKHQAEDGYFNIFFTVIEPENRFKYRWAHELYCAGHLFEAAVAYYEVTGKDRFLKLMEKYADYIYKVFLEEKSAEFRAPGHQEIEMALIRMYRVTKNRKYLELSKYFLDIRGTEDDIGNDAIPSQSHLPIREQKEAVGHSVRACYMYSAMADLAYETKDTELYNACKTIFNNIVNKRMYVTGGVGSTRHGEAFTADYDLENERAYAETCAAISLIFFAHRMFQFENDSVYADIIERILYNGMISGLSLSGDAFFYENPLEIDLKNYTKYSSEQYKETFAMQERQKVFWCSCCPPNLNRVLSTLGQYIYGTEEGTIYVNQFAGSVANVDGMEIEQITDFPKTDSVIIKTKNVKKLCVRIPSWCDNFSIDGDYTVENGYAVIKNPKEEIKVSLPMIPYLVESNIGVHENSGKVAVQMGPFVCAAESVDNIENLHSIFIDKNLKCDAKYSDELKGYLLDVKAFRKISNDKLYSKITENYEDYTLKMIPYASFANRGESNMLVWFNAR